MKKIAALALAGIFIFLLGDRYVHSKHRVVRSVELNTIAQVLAEYPASQQPDSPLLEAIHGRSRDLVFSMVLDRDNNPVLFGNVPDPGLKGFLSRNPVVNGWITEFERDPDRFVSVAARKQVEVGRWGVFSCRALTFNANKLFLLFLEKRLGRDLMLLRLGAAGYAILFLVLSLLILRGSIPRVVRRLRRTGSRTDGTDAGFDRKQVVNEQLEQLGFFREIALATNTITELPEMIKAVLPIFAMRFPSTEIVFYLARTGGEDILLPDHGFVNGAVLGREELGQAGYAEESVDGLVREMETAGEAARTLVPLKDSESYVGFIIVKGAGLDEIGRQDLAAVSRQIAMAVKNSLLYNEAVTDGLTGLHVHRYFQLKMDEEIRRFQRHTRVFSLILMDIDDFKAVNDTHGHPAGDYVLSNLAVLIKGLLRVSDIAFRYGGEEFAVLLPETDLTAAFQTAERVRTAVAGNSFVYESTMLKLTLSLGVAAVRPAESKEELIKRCDAALYKAKQEGKNRSVIGE